VTVGRVLVVDDEPDILEVLTDILGGLGYDISTAANGAEALAIVRMRPPDVVLLDLTMPVMSGLSSTLWMW
jgi:CheY-like chemotaxis protein